MHYSQYINIRIRDLIDYIISKSPDYRSALFSLNFLKN